MSDGTVVTFPRPEKSLDEIMRLGQGWANKPAGFGTEYHAELTEAERVVLCAALNIAISHYMPPETGRGDRAEDETKRDWERWKSNPRWTLWDTLLTAVGDVLDGRPEDEAR